MFRIAGVWGNFCRRGDSRYNVPLRTRKLRILRRAQHAKNAQNVNRRYTAGTRTDFDCPRFGTYGNASSIFGHG